MIIAQNSVDIDENASLANSANNLANEALKNAENIKSSLTDDYNKKLADARTKYTSLNNGRITNTTYTPFSVNDINQHVEGDMWVQQSSDGTHAIAMWYWHSGAWQQQTWDQQSLHVQNLGALNADLGYVRSGHIDSVGITAATIDVDINGNDNAHDSGYNSVTWDAQGFNASDPGSPGYHFHNGLMQFRGRRTSGDYTGSWDNLFLGPNDVKLRNNKSWSNGSTGQDSLNDRIDIRSDFIEIAKAYGTPHTHGSITGCSINSDGSAVISEVLYTDHIEAGYTKGHIKINSAIDTNYWINAPGVSKPSDLSLKNVKSKFDTKRALAEVTGTDIYTYCYKGNNDDKNIGPIIDDVHDINKSEYKVSEYMLRHDDDGKDFISLDNTIGLLIGSVNELSKQNEILLGKITQLEAKENGNN